MRKSACSSVSRVGHAKQIRVGEGHAHRFGLAALQRGREAEHVACAAARRRHGAAAVHAARGTSRRSPQPTVQETSTRSPFLTPRTPVPDVLDDAEELVADREAAARPIAAGRPPCQRWRSEPQIAVRATRTIASVSPSSAGIGRVLEAEVLLAVIDDRFQLAPMTSRRPQDSGRANTSQLDLEADLVWKSERSVVRQRGLEPPWGCPRQPLKLVRLPISPLPRAWPDNDNEADVSRQAASGFRGVPPSRRAPRVPRRGPSPAPSLRARDASGLRAPAASLPGSRRRRALPSCAAGACRGAAPSRSASVEESLARRLRPRGRRARGSSP